VKNTETQIEKLEKKRRKSIASILLSLSSSWQLRVVN